MNISDRTTTGMLMTTINGIGAKVPKAVTDGYEEASRVSASARSLGVGREDLSLAVTEALTAGRDPGTDPEVQRVLIASQIANEGVMTGVQSIAFERFREVCTVHADAIVAAWRKPLDAAAATLATCFDKIGPLPLEDTGSIMQRGGDVAAVWAEAQKASKVIETVRTGWVALGEFTRTVPVNPDYRVLQLADASFSQWNEHTLRRRNMTPWEYLLAGLSLSLPTAAEYRGRVQVITDGMTQATRAAERVSPERAGVQDWSQRVEAASKAQVTA